MSQHRISPDGTNLAETRDIFHKLGTGMYNVLLSLAHSDLETGSNIKSDPKKRLAAYDLFVTLKIHRTNNTADIRLSSE